MLRYLSCRIWSKVRPDTGPDLMSGTPLFICMCFVSAPSSQMGGTPTCSTTMSSAPRVLNPSFSPATAAVVPPPPLVKAEEIAQPNVPSPQPFPNVPINPQPLATLSTPSQVPTEKTLQIVET